MTSRSPANSLHGLTLGGWQVGELLPRSPDQTGGHFSVSYSAVHETDGHEGFLKAVDLVKELADPSKLAQKIKNFEYEDKILKLCAGLKMEGVVIPLFSGTHKTVYNGIPIAVPYIIFEKASGDLRTHKLAQSMNYAWRLRVFHSACVSMMHLHRAEIAHQDIKPSNVLIFKELRAKVADLGHATKRGMPSEFEQEEHKGDKNYIPIELLYRHFNSDNWIRRRFGADMFMMGCLLTYLVADVSLLTLIFKKLDRRFWPESWNASGFNYEDVRPHIEMVFDEVMTEIKATMPNHIASEVCHIISSLSHPDCQRRGRPALLDHPTASIEGDDSDAVFRAQYSFETFVSRIDVVAKKAELGSGLDKERFWQYYKKETGL